MTTVPPLVRLGNHPGAVVAGHHPVPQLSKVPAGMGHVRVYVVSSQVVRPLGRDERHVAVAHEHLADVVYAVFCFEGECQFLYIVRICI
jgi:hypothetical protein